MTLIRYATRGGLYSLELQSDGDGYCIRSFKRGECVGCSSGFVSAYTAEEVLDQRIADALDIDGIQYRWVTPYT